MFYQTIINIVDALFIEENDEYHDKFFIDDPYLIRRHIIDKEYIFDLLSRDNLLKPEFITLGYFPEKSLYDTLIADSDIKCIKEVKQKHYDDLYEKLKKVFYFIPNEHSNIPEVFFMVYKSRIIYNRDLNLVIILEEAILIR